MRRVILGLVVLLAGIAAAALVYAPYLPQLLVEGFPPLIWPDRGYFAQVDGAVQPTPLVVSEAGLHRSLAPEFDTTFVESGGKALLVFRAGRLELEHYGDGVSADTRLNSYSMAKSLVGALVYRALAEGRLASLDATLGELLQEERNGGLRDVTIRSLLTMQSGISFDGGEALFGGKLGSKDVDSTPNPFGPLARLHFLGLSSIEGSLSVDGTVEHPFSYQNVNTALLGAVVETLYQRPLPELLGEKIWLPAGAATASWRRPGETISVSAYCCLYATARDWVRVGLFLAQNGTAANPFLPEPLWREFLGLDLEYAARQQGHYGQHIYQDVLDRPGQALQGPFSYMFGQGGQLLYLMPEQELVVFRSGDTMPLLHSTLYGAWNTVNEISR